MKILLFGKNGQVGWELNRSLQPLGKVMTLGREDADFSKPENLRKIVQEIKPDVIVNAVAYTAVDKAESEAELAGTINGLAPGILAEEALKIHALLIHYSTDYVFDGAKETPYLETDAPNPINVYGRTKLAGEQAIQSSGCDYLIFRTSWVYASRASNFMLTMLRLAQEREELSIVSDQLGAPTTARLIADTTAFCLHQIMRERISDAFSSDLYHVAAAGCTSWHGFTKEIVSEARQVLNMQFIIKKIDAIPTSRYPMIAKRPMNSRLSLTKLESTFAIELPDWKDTLLLCIEDLTES